MFPVIQRTWIVWVSIILNGLLSAFLIASAIAIFTKPLPAGANPATPIFSLLFFVLSFWVSVSHLKLMRQKTKNESNTETFE